MLRFKIGDKVYSRDHRYGDILPEEVGVVVEYWKNHTGEVQLDVPYPYVVDFGKDPDGNERRWLFGDDELEAVEATNV